MSKRRTNRTQAHLTFLDNLYATAMVGDWEKILAEVANLTHGCGGNVLLYDRARGSIPLLRSHQYDNTTMQDYSQHYISIDPKATFLQNNPATQLYFDDLYISEKEKNKHPYYAWEQKAGDKHYTIGALLHQNDNMAFIFSTGLTKNQLVYKEQAIETYRLIYPHLKRAVQISRLLELKSNQALTLTDQLDKHPAGVFILDKKGRVLYCNTMGHSLLSENDGINLINNQIEFTSPEADRSFKRQLGVLACSSDSRYILPIQGGHFVIPRTSGLVDYEGILNPINETNYLHLHLHDHPSAILLINTSEKRRTPNCQQLIRLHGLSRKEAALAAELAQGSSLAKAADLLEISLNTAKVHLRHIFAKTQTKDQTQLIRLLLTSPLTVNKEKSEDEQT